MLILGCPGSGKSTMARLLAARTGLPVIHLDRLYWRKGWVEQDKAVWQAQVAEVLAAPAWIIDGTYGGTLTQRLAAADAAILLDYPRWLCLVRALKRVLLGFGRARDDMADGCPERLSLSFLIYIWNFRREKRPRIADELRRFSGRVIVLRTSAEATRWLNSEDVQTTELPRVRA
ncbi:AAA family ATPase [Granulicella sibirica]|uniref:AAA family ATPase n=1 Tax=Granulicella sibirica TaxID=2479048 RepID=UPI001F5019F4|nr:AAA family ATPase [Granulicella sibirica]